MSRLLWGVSKLVNDPSTALFNEIRQRIFRKNEDGTSIDGEDPDLSKSNDNNFNVLQMLDGSLPSTSRKYIQSEKGPRCRYVQVGNGFLHNRQVSIQCRRSVHGMLNKSTSIQQLRRSDRGTGGSRTVMNVDASTTPEKRKVCKQHLEVISALRNWPSEEKSKTELVIKVSKREQIKNAFYRFIHSLKIEKIQCIPPYRSPEKEEIKLYRCPSINLEDQEKTLRKRSKTRKLDKLTTLKSAGLT